MAQLAKFTVWGTPGTIAFTGLAAADNAARGVELEDVVRVADCRDGNGRIFASNVTRDAQTLTLSLVPFDSATPGTLVTAKSKPALPPPGALITLAGFGSSLVDGDWNYVGGGRITYGATEEDPIVITGVQCRRVSANGSSVAAQTVLS